MKVEFKGKKQSEPTRHGDFGVRYAPAKRAAFKWRWYFLLLLVISPILYFLWQVVDEQVLVQAEGILTTEPVVLTASQDAFIETVLTDPGDPVKSGQILIDLKSPEIEREVELLGEKLAGLKDGAAQAMERVKSLRSKQVDMLEAALETHTKLTKDYEGVKYEGLVALGDKVTLEEAYREVKSELTEAKVKYEIESNYEKRAAWVEAFSELERKQAIAQVKQELLNVRSPKDGIVNEIYVSVGEYVSEGNLLAEISNYPEPVVDVYLHPKRMEYTRVGQMTTVTLPNGQKHRAQIKEPVQIVEKLPGALAGPFEESKTAIKAILHFENPPERWIEGLPVKVLFDY
jgi:multidrug resistance efflux pump